MQKHTYMKLIFLFIVLYFGRAASSCNKKNSIPTSSADTTFTIKINACATKTAGLQNATLCFDSVMQDSRCPKGAFCIWAGTAIAKFTFSKNGISYPLTLATAPYSRFPVDTLLSGYKIKFINLTPYPGTFTPPAPKDQIKAEVQITKQ